MLLLRVMLLVLDLYLAKIKRFLMRESSLFKKALRVLGLCRVGSIDVGINILGKRIDEVWSIFLLFKDAPSISLNKGPSWLPKSMVHRLFCLILTSELLRVASLCRVRYGICDIHLSENTLELGVYYICLIHRQL